MSRASSALFHFPSYNVNRNELNLMLSIFKRQLIVHVVFVVRSALKNSSSMDF